MRVRRLALLSMLALPLPMTARAQKLTNGDFEAGLLDYAVFVNGTGFFAGATDALCALSGTAGPGNSGCFFVQAPPTAPGEVTTSGNGTFLRSLGGLTIGATYDLSLQYRRITLTALDVFLGFGDDLTVISHTNDPCTFGRTCTITVSNVATESRQVLQFGASRFASSAVSLGGSVTLDNLTLTVRSTTTPEPGTWTLLGTGLAALGLVARRRRSA